ncbi:MAG: hypothetical protein G01um101470_450 [Parcubacteria group bacterium Gr01-1014_70]|nr:MAG: hypothetical protein G01um101470_450 [Parcubacteria group bacterium Gr01-1014_70]
MNSEHGLWEVRVKKPAQKNLKRAPRHEREGLIRVLEEMTHNPFSNNITSLTNERATFRRRFGDFRIFFDIYRDHRLVEIVDIDRRTTTTYRKR